MCEPHEPRPPAGRGAGAPASHSRRLTGLRESAHSPPDVLAVVEGPLPQGSCVAGSGRRWFGLQFGLQFGRAARGLDVPRAGSRGLFSPLRLSRAFCLFAPPLPAVHPQRQESGSGCEADHRGKSRGTPRGLLEPRDPGFVPGHPRAS